MPAMIWIRRLLVAVPGDVDEGERNAAFRALAEAIRNAP